MINIYISSLSLSIVQSQLIYLRINMTVTEINSFEEFRRIVRNASPLIDG
jgi:hypothetical protein